MAALPAGEDTHPFAYRRHLHRARATDDYVFAQLLPYIGNKRKLLPLIAEGLARCGEPAADRAFVDLFSGSTVVSRIREEASACGVHRERLGALRQAVHCSTASVALDSREPHHRGSGRRTTRAIDAAERPHAGRLGLDHRASVPARRRPAFDTRVDSGCSSCASQRDAHRRHPLPRIEAVAERDGLLSERRRRGLSAWRPCSTQACYRSQHERRLQRRSTEGWGGAERHGDPPHPAAIYGWRLRPCGLPRQRRAQPRPRHGGDADSSRSTPLRTGRTETQVSQHRGTTSTRRTTSTPTAATTTSSTPLPLWDRAATVAEDGHRRQDRQQGSHPHRLAHRTPQRVHLSTTGTRRLQAFEERRSTRAMRPVRMS